MAATTTPITVNVTLELSAEFLGDILVTAFDGSFGGCWYWARPVEDGNAWLTHDSDHNQTWRACRIREREDGPAGPFVVDHEALARGIAFLFKPGVLPHLGNLRSAVLNQDAGNIDSGDADVLVQLACFEEVVYG